MPESAESVAGDLPKMSHSPWSEEQVRSLNEYQKSGVFHPFTCGVCRDADPAFPLVDQHLLVATHDGWRCPTCDYMQDWAWPFMVEDTWRNIEPDHDLVVKLAEYLSTVPRSQADMVNAYGILIHLYDLGIELPVAHNDGDE